MKTLILSFLLFNLSLSASPFIEPAKKALAATVLILADGKKQSGFLASPDGIVLTLYHPLKDAQNITIQKGDLFYPATLLSEEVQADIAVLQIPGHHFPYLEVVSSRDVLPGQWALIAGFPTRRLSVRRALISSLDREFLVVDTPFNKGELGGPLLNLEGDVIGINCSNKENLGFSIPLD